MNMQPNRALFDADDVAARQERKSLLRFIVCGSVDHGKSTLIGRLLYESGLVLSDQLQALGRDRGRDGEELDFSLLLDGLAAEREQKITIDVAYRFFATAQRRYIVADAPGHEQYTRNMATGASTADLALLLVSANDGLTRQTRRHAVIVSTLGVRRFVVAINKMDLVGWSESRFAELQAEFTAFVRDLNVDEVAFIPLSARDGENLVDRSQRMLWYHGPSLLEYLETVEIESRPRSTGFRMPVQYVNRPESTFRGYCGLVTNGDVYPGMPVLALPSGQRTHIARIVTADGDLANAGAGQAVTLTLSDDIDVSRGDVISDCVFPPPIADRFDARLVWIGPDALEAGSSYLMKLATATATATIEQPLGLVDLNSNRSAVAGGLAANDIGTAVIKLDRLIAADRYLDRRDTGSFILIDPETGDTVALGIIEGMKPAAVRAATTNLHHLIRSAETHARSIAKAVSWRATGSLDTFVVAALVTGNSKLACGVALAEILTKTALYYVHERAWALIPWGRRQRSLMEMIAPPAAALVAFDVEDVEIADNVAECLATSRGITTTPQPATCKLSLGEKRLHALEKLVRTLE
jgi:sulfate adenylyltransferase large subunit